MTLDTPLRAWELVQTGNCGPPIETERGWLVLTHGVGAMRTYGLGAMLLDLDDPRKVLATSELPILVADDDEQDGYVPNVVYSCGGCATATRWCCPTASATSRSRSRWSTFPACTASSADPRPSANDGLTTA